MPLTEVSAKSRYGKYTQMILNLCDLLIVNLLFGITLWIMPDAISSRPRELWLLVNISYLPIIFWTSAPGQRNRAMHIDRVVKHSLVAVVMHALFFLALIAFLGLGVKARAMSLFYSMMLVVFPLFWISTRLIIKSMRKHGFNQSSVVIVGINPTSERLVEEIRSDAGFGYKLLGFFDDSCPEGFTGKYLGTIDDLAEFVQKNDVHQLFYTYTNNTSDDLSRAVKIADDCNCEFFYVPRITRFVNRAFTLNTIASMPVLGIRRNPLTHIINRIYKRSFDLAVSSVFLLFYPLIYIPIAIAIKIGSPGPVYFRQERTGYRGTPFQCLKFRTMKVNAKADECQATKNDPRKTRLGEFLRHTSLDELPQFINVWKGDMSIVGPRPHMLKHTEQYSAIIDRYMVRHMVKPGITGWAQVNGYRGLTDELWKMEKRVEFDVWYIENWSILLDLKIMARTVINAVAGEKNAF